VNEQRLLKPLREVHTVSLSADAVRELHNVRWLTVPNTPKAVEKVCGMKRILLRLLGENLNND